MLKLAISSRDSGSAVNLAGRYDCYLIQILNTNVHPRLFSVWISAIDCSSL